MIEDDGLGRFGTARGRSGGSRWRGLETALLLLAAALLAPDAANAQQERCPRPETARLSQLWWSPCDPAAGDRDLEFALPLPVDGASMLFVEVRTPGADVFEGCAGADARLPIYGAANDPFAPSEQRVVGGAFRGDDSWRYFLAKYELTVGQAAAILAGDPGTGAPGALTTGLQALADLLDDGAGGAKLAQVRPLLWRFRSLSFGVWTDADGQMARGVAEHLARPVAGLTAGEYEALAERYTAWCYRSEDCRAHLEQRASFDGALGFVRLPSRLEWEHAARGGAVAATDAGAADLEGLPFARQEIDDYANLGDARKDADAPPEAVVGVGRKPTPGGFYDLFGNVAELTADFFDSSAQGGKLGGRAIRGGWFATPPDSVSAGMTEELPLFAFDAGTHAFLGPERNAHTGARFAIGGVVKTSPAFVETALAERRRKSCAGGAPELADTAQIATATARPAEPASEPKIDSAAVATIEALRRNMESADRSLAETGEAHCRTLAEKLFLLARLQINYWSQSHKMAPMIKQVEDENLHSKDPSYYDRLRLQLMSQKARLEHTSRRYLETYLATATSLAGNSEHCIQAGFSAFEQAESGHGLLSPDPRAEDGEFSAKDILDQVISHVKQAVENGDPASLKDAWQTDFIEIGRQLAESG